MITWRLGPERAAEWRDIRLTALRDAPDAFGARLADWQHRPLADFVDWLTRTTIYAAGREKGLPLASAGWQALDPDDPLCGILLAVFVRTEARGQGYGEAVVQAAMSDAARSGMTSMRLKVHDLGGHAQSLYRRLGFQESGGPIITNERGLREIHMARAQL